MPSGFSFVTRCEPRTLVSACEDRVARDAAAASAAARRGSGRLSSAIAMSRCSVLTYSSFRRSASACAWSVTSLSRGDMPGCDAAVRLRQLRRAARARRAPIARRIGVHLAQQLGDDAVALLDERDEQVLGLDLRVVASAARARSPPATASCAFSVYLLMFIASSQLSLSSSSIAQRVSQPCVLRLSRASAAPRSASRCSGVSCCGSCDVDRRVEIAVLVRLAGRPACRGPSAGTPARSASSAESSAAATCRRASAPPPRRRAPRSSAASATRV